MPSVCSFVDPNLLTKSNKIRDIGSGTFGSVALYETPLGRYVVKETKKMDHSAGYPADFVTEVDALFKFRAISTVIQMDGVCFDSTQKRGFILLESMETNLRRWYATQPFSERIKAIPALISQIGGALAIMHSVGFVHGDIKNNNILSNPGLSFKLADFGGCRYITDPLVHYGAIARYRPYRRMPVFHEELYAFCVVLVETITGHNMIYYRTDNEQEISIKRFYERYGKKDTDIRSFLKDTLDKDEYRQVPDIFWNYALPILSGKDGDAVRCLRRVGLDISEQTMESVKQVISTQGQLHPKLSLVKKRGHKIINSRYHKRAEQYSKLFDRLMSKFLYSPEGSRLNDRSIEYYAEIALICLLGKHYMDSNIFPNDTQLLLFQRSFMAAISYQTIVLPK